MQVEFKKKTFLLNSYHAYEHSERRELKLVSHQETTAWQLLATLTTAFLNDCLTNLSKYLAIVVYND